MATWLSVEKKYEGFPLLLRYPTDLDVESLRPDFPSLAIVTHDFRKHLPSGLPEADYNDGLAEMDHELIVAFDVGRTGVPVLIETFGGKRRYYFYVAEDADVPAVVSALARRHAEERLSWSVRPDPKWGFFESYARENF
jgi:hypothetical protein